MTSTATVEHGTVKKRVVELMIEYFKPYRDKREELQNNVDFVQDVLKDGAERASAVASETLKKVRKAAGLGA